jgi:TPR repeat protein
MGSSDAKSAPDAAPRQTPQPTLAAAATAAPTAVAAAPAANAAAPAATLPSRDEIALALRTAHQNQPPAEGQQQVLAAVAPVAAVPVAAAPAVAMPPARRIDSEELANLMTRAKALLASGDISPARLLLERAAQANEASAALMLAQTYDPTVLGTQDIRNITPDPAMARTWYQRAAQLGSADAQRRLSQLQ